MVRIPRTFATACVLAACSIPLIGGAGTAQAADEAGPPQPEAVIMTRTCEQNGAVVVMNNLGGGSVTFNVLADNEASGTYTVLAGSQASHLVPIMEDQTVAIQVTADGMAPVTGARTRDCENPQPAAADATTAATDPVDAVPAGTPPPQAVPPTAVAGASDTPTDSTTAPAADPVAPTGTLPFTGAPELAWLALSGVLLLGAGATVRRRAAVHARAAARDRASAR
jgi:hypothetical protein